METQIAYFELLKYLKNLCNASCDLKSKMTALILFIEEAEGLSANEKNCLLGIIQTISSKNNQVISAENQLLRVMELMFKQTSASRKRGYTLLEA